MGAERIAIPVDPDVDRPIVIAEHPPADHVASRVQLRMALVDPFTGLALMILIGVALHRRQQLGDRGPWCERLAVDVFEDLDTGLGDLLDDVAGLGHLAADRLLFTDNQHAEWRS
ncbi:MAG TPA: hypothetical protein VNJ02_19635 [Vicinamibacterales bacterium]|nr:hypothetical protein [Vicinamibacterales bacterium]